MVYDTCKYDIVNSYLKQSISTKELSDVLLRIKISNFKDDYFLGLRMDSWVK